MSFTPTVVFPDSMGDLKVWLVNHPLLTPLVGGRVYFRLPDTVVYPAIRMYQAGGVPDLYVPTDELRISLEVWGGADTDYPVLRQIVAALKSVFFQADNVTLNPASSTLLLNGTVSSTVDAPDADAGQPRIVVDFIVYTRHL